MTGSFHVDARETFQQTMLEWFTTHGRDLPWRKTYDPYQVWIAEIMLQQTQVARVLDYFTRWHRRFPTIDQVARADLQEIFILWEGLGYYRRAENIKKAAGIIARDHGGVFPETFDQVIGLPGIGRYTAGAILSTAFNQDVPLVDANVERVFSRIFDIALPLKNSAMQKRLWQTAEELIPGGQARMFNQSLMELGALICLSGTPLCGTCPVSDHCLAYRNKTVGQRPVPKKKQETVQVVMATGVLIHEGRLFIQKRPRKGVWANLWEFPGGRIEAEETPEEALVREFMEETELRVEGLEPMGIIKHSYTVHRVTLHAFFCRLKNRDQKAVLHAAQDGRWVLPEELSEYAFSAGHRKVIDLMARDLRFFGMRSGS